MIEMDMPKLPKRLKLQHFLYFQSRIHSHPATTANLIETLEPAPKTNRSLKN